MKTIFVCIDFLCRDDRLFSTAFENLSFDKLMSSIKISSPNDLLLFLLAKLIPEFSPEKKKEVIQELGRWINKSWTNSKHAYNRLKGIWTELMKYLVGIELFVGFIWIFRDCQDPSEIQLLLPHCLPLWKAIDSCWHIHPKLCTDLMEVLFPIFWSLIQFFQTSFECIMSGMNQSNSEKLLSKMTKYVMQLQTSQKWNSSTLVLQELVEFVQSGNLQNTTSLFSLFFF